jgi:hypothetical protein
LRDGNPPREQAGAQYLASQRTRVVGQVQEDEGEPSLVEQRRPGRDPLVLVVGSGGRTGGGRFSPPQGSQPLPTFSLKFS